MFLFKTVLLIIFPAAFAVDNAEIPQVDRVINSLSSQQWDDDEATCRDKIFSVLNNVKNSTLWATWIWDSNPKAPLGTFFGARFHFGNYDQCLRPPWLSEHPELRTQYCLADIEMSKDPAVKNWDLPGPYAKAEDYYVDGGMPTGRSFSFMSYGVCLPVGCQTKSVTKFVKALLRDQHLTAAWDADVKIQHCEEAGAPIVLPRGYYTYMYTFAAVVCVALASTYYICEYPGKAKSNTFVNHVAKSFCLRRNWETLFKEEKDTLLCLHGIKLLTAALVIRVHIASFSNKISIANGIDLEKGYENLKSCWIIHIDLIVDTFFATSALLLGRSLSTLDVTKPYNLIKSIVKRYIRLVGPLVVTVFYVSHVMLYKDNGPLYHKLIKHEQDTCQQNWWLSLLMVGNYVNVKYMCIIATWYIPCDFHLYVMTLGLLYIYRKNQKLGKITTAIVVFLGFLGPALNQYLYDLPAILNLNFMANDDLRLTENFTNGYVHTHIRMGPYMVGLLVGYLTSVYKPADYKKIWSKTQSFFGCCTGVALMVAISAVGGLCYHYRVFGLLSGVYRTFDRTVFASGVLCVIVFCSYGDVPLVNSFLSWAPFRVLSRLTYGIYVIHPVLIYKSKMAARSHLRHHSLDYMVETFGVLMISLFLSLMMWLLVEAPLMNFTNKYLDTRSKLKTAINGVASGMNQNGETIENKVEKTKAL